MMFFAIFWTAYVPFLTVLLSIAFKSAIGAVRRLRRRKEAMWSSAARLPDRFRHRRRPACAAGQRSRRGQITRTTGAARLRRTHS